MKLRKYQKINIAILSGYLVVMMPVAYFELIDASMSFFVGAAVFAICMAIQFINQKGRADGGGRRRKVIELTP